jgi:hypothetical protein
MKKTTFAYIAGIMDGEGHFTIARTKRPGSKEGSTSLHYTAMLGVTNTYLPLIKHLIKALGGTYYISRDNGKDKTLYKWVVNNNKSREKVLLAVLPYLFEKRNQAKLLLHFVRLDGVANPALREAIFREMQTLHGKGIVETNTSNIDRDVVKIESELVSDNESVPVVTQVPLKD